MAAEHFETDWLDKTLTMLKNRPATLSMKDIAEATGLGLRWLFMFQAGDIEGPNVNAVNTLYNMLLKFNK